MFLLRSRLGYIPCNWLVSIECILVKTSWSKSHLHRVQNLTSIKVSFRNNYPQQFFKNKCSENIVELSKYAYSVIWLLSQFLGQSASCKNSLDSISRELCVTFGTSENKNYPRKNSIASIEYALKFVSGNFD